MMVVGNVLSIVIYLLKRLKLALNVKKNFFEVFLFIYLLKNNKFIVKF